jgi:hypothetical protein
VGQDFEVIGLLNKVLLPTSRAFTFSVGLEIAIVVSAVMAVDFRLGVVPSIV